MGIRTDGQKDFMGNLFSDMEAMCQRLLGMELKKRNIDNPEFRQWLEELCGKLHMYSDAADGLLYPDVKSRLREIFSDDAWKDISIAGSEAFVDLKKFGGGLLDAGKRKFSLLTSRKPSEMTEEDAKRIAAAVKKLTDEKVPEELAAKIVAIAYGAGKV